MSPRTRAWLLIIAAMVVGAVFRMTNLDREGLWLDELATVRIITRESWGAAIQELAIDFHPPLYFAGMRLWWLLSGDGEAWLRLPAAIAGVGSVGLMGWLGWLLSDRWTGVAAAWIYACTPFVITLEREVRGNGVMCFLGLLCAGLLAQHLDGVERRRIPLLLVAVAGLVLTHPFGAFIVGALGIWVMLERKTGLAVLVVAFGAAVAIAWYLPVQLGRVEEFVESPWYLAPSLDSLAWLWGELMFGTVGPSVLLLAGIGLALVSGKSPRLVLLLGSTVAAVIVIPQILSYVVVPILRDRNVVFVLPTAILVAAHGYRSLADVRIATGLVLLTTFASGVVAHQRVLKDRHGEQWREIAGQVQQKVQEGEVIYANHPWYWRYYLPEPLPIFDLRELPDPLVGKVWLLAGHTPQSAVAHRLRAEGVVLQDLSAPGAHAMLAYPGKDSFELGQWEVHDHRLFTRGQLQFLYNAIAKSPVFQASGLCEVGVGMWGDLGGDALPALEVQVTEEGASTPIVHTVLTVGPNRALLFTGAQQLDGQPVRISLAFVNDPAPDAGFDRNVYVDEVLLRCIPAGSGE